MASGLEQETPSEAASRLPSISVVVVSRDRVDSLRRTLHSLFWQHYSDYEIILVADSAALAQLAQEGLTEGVKCCAFDEANISAARNLGIGQAAGKVVAFIDDDATAEPTWLAHLGAAFRDLSAAAAGGYVRGRNGISYQWEARSIDRRGIAHSLEVVGTDPVVPTVSEGLAVKTEGTNMAVRREVLLQLGGFDPTFRFYLDESDLNLRLAAQGFQTAIVPLAQVHHAYAPSERRTQNRAVRDLSDVGASSRVFWRKHCPELEVEALLLDLRSEQRHRLLRLRRRRKIGTEEMHEVLQTLETGLQEGAQRAFAEAVEFDAPPPFKRFASKANGQHRVLAGRWWSARQLRRQAAELAAQGVTVSLFLFSHTSLFHKVQMLGPGVWEQRGGLFGRSDRDQPLFVLHHFSGRVSAETTRLSGVRANERSSS